MLTGGGAKLPGIKELAKKELKLPCRIGAPRGFSLSQEEPSLSALCGLVLEGMNLEEDKGGFPNVGKTINNKVNNIKNFFKQFKPS